MSNRADSDPRTTHHRPRRGRGGGVARAIGLPAAHFQVAKAEGRVRDSAGRWCIQGHLRDRQPGYSRHSGARAELAAISRYALQKFAIVRYDAFGDMGGQLSFSVALLDEHGDGVVITSINGRTETRSYAKPVRGMTSAHNLSDEEREAIASAVSGTGRGDSALTPSRAR